MYDKNGDNKITLGENIVFVFFNDRIFINWLFLDEFGDVIKNLGLNPSKDQLKTLMKEIDLDGKQFKF